MNPATVLSRVPNVLLELQSDGSTRVFIGGRQYNLGPYTLSVLDAFAQPTNVLDGISRLGVRITGELAKAEIIGTIYALLEIGVLADLNGLDLRRHVKPFPLGGYDTPAVHVAILNDVKRKSTFLEAIRRVIRPGDAVLDLGTGTGIMAVAAVRAGARKVYAVEPSAFGQWAEQVFRDNDVAQQITLIKGWASQLSLPEPCDVLITDIVGNEPLDMRIRESIADAFERLLKPDARVIPASIRFYIYLANIPAEIVRKYTFTSERVSDWRAAYSINFGCLINVARNHAAPVYVTPTEASCWRRLTEPALVFDLDMHNCDFKSIVTEPAIDIPSPITANGIVGYFTLDLGGGVEYSACPSEASSDCHWFTPVWLFENAEEFEPQESVRFKYSYVGNGQSTLSRIIQPQSSPVGDSCK